VVDVRPGESRAGDEIARVMLDHYAAGDFDEFTRRRLALPGRCLCHRNGDLMTRKEWVEDWNFVDARRPSGLDGTMVATYRVSEHCEAHVGLDRSLRASEFTSEECDLLEAFMAGAQLWLREQCLVRGWIECEVPLSPRERDVIQQLLTGSTEKQVARELGMTPRTVHFYVTELCRRFGASGRRGLMALWLRSRERAESASAAAMSGNGDALRNRG
jgi:DNA-binding CsgD family transcriptional regulator